MPLTPQDARQALRMFARNYPTQIDAAKALGLSVQYLRDLLHEKRDLSPRVLAKLGLRRKVVIESIDPPAATPGVDLATQSSADR